MMRYFARFEIVDGLRVPVALYRHGPGADDLFNRRGDWQPERTLAAWLVLPNEYDFEEIDQPAAQKLMRVTVARAMLTEPAARARASEVLAAMATQDDLMLGGGSIESDWAWAFPWNSRAYLESGDPLTMLIGSGPIVVPKDDTGPFIMNSRSSVEAQLDAWEATHDAPGSLGRAIRIAHEAHAGQVDKSGADYIGHPLRVMARVTTIEEKKVAVLHDVVEDSAWTLSDLRSEGFGDSVIAAVDALTKRPGETLPESMARVVAVPLAHTVKLADVADNSDPQRLALLPIVARERLKKKYAETSALLSSSPLLN